MDTVLSKFSVNVLNISKRVCGRQNARRGRHSGGGRIAGEAVKVER